MRRLLSIRALCVIVIAAAAPMYVSPASASPGELDRKDEALAHMKDAGASDARILEELGLRKVSTDEPSPRLLSDEWDAPVSIPEIYYDHGQGTYYASTSFRWVNNKWSGDSPLLPGAVGGPDLIAIRVSRAIYYVRGTATTCPSSVPSGFTPAFGNCATHTTAYQTNEFGTAIRFQDRVGNAVKYNSTNCSNGQPYCDEYMAQYNAFSGTLVFEFGFFSSNSCHQFFSHLGHTWADSSINSVGVGPYSLSVGWNNSDKKWLGASPSSGKFWC